MVFSSLEFIFGFLPVTLLVVAILTWRHWDRYIPATLVVASLIFYGFWNPTHLWVIAATILGNYTVSLYLINNRSRVRAMMILTLGISFNLLLLGYFKYSGFIAEQFEGPGTEVGFLGDIASTALPIGISFYTFQQIAYLVDVRRGVLLQRPPLVNYTLFVTFFPQLIAGPIVHHREVMPQMAKISSRWRSRRYVIRYLIPGLVFLIIGLSKKVLLADRFAYYADIGFEAAVDMPLSILEAWGAALSYTFQIYFDFSGYTDMAIGLGLLFCVHLPRNFNSPYQATSIVEFWRRWHMTLSRFLRDYLYIPLGGNRGGQGRRYFNLLATMVLGGLWHGAAWTFVLWGAMHGIALAGVIIWRQLFPKLLTSKFLGISVTFLFVVFAWVPFRAGNVDEITTIWRGMVGLNGIIIPERYASLIEMLGPISTLIRLETGLVQSFGGFPQILWLALGGFIVFSFRNSTVLFNRIERNRIIRHILVAPALSFLLIASLVQLFISDKEVFLYYQF